MAARRTFVGAALVGLLSVGAACSEDEPAEQPIAPDEEAPANAAAPAQEPAPSVPTATAQALEALGYVPSAPTDNPDERGVTAVAEDASHGLNLYSSRRRASALLTDMEGEVLHRWEDPEHDKSWMHVEPLPGGELLVITKDRDVSKLAWDSTRIWRQELRAHHDLAVRGDGRLLVLVRDRREHTWEGREIPVLADAIAILSPDGEVERRVELLPLLGDLIPAQRLARIGERLADTPVARLVRPGGAADVFHTNSIELLTVDIPGVAPAGSILLSSRSLDRIVIVDAGMTRVLWTWGRGELQRQHDAKQLDDGRILVFDNGPHRGHSRVIEVDPVAGEIVWSYETPDLFSRLRGGAQKLANGNILVTESDRGHALEVTRGGEIVWEFWNPDVRGGPAPERGVIYRLNRFPASIFAPHLSR